MSELGDRENQNILDLKIEKAVERALTASSNPPELLSSASALGFPLNSAGFF
jgi:hypothetical protein